LKRATGEWIDKAEGDYAVAGREFAVAHPVFDAVCFHAQQCAEKYLKALLQEHGVAFPRTHDLVALVALAEGAAPALASLRPELARLTAFAVAPRYPGTSTTRADADAAMKAARCARNALRMVLGL